MPLRDHFRPPVSTRSSWEGFHGGWPMAMVQRLSPLLPPEFTAEPRVHLGTLTVDMDLTHEYAYEILVYNHAHGRRLVAAVEIVSPANKDRLENRCAFATKCAALLQQGVSVSMVDLVTIRHFNLYLDLLALLDRSDPSFTPASSSIYAATCRARMIGGTWRLESWAYPLTVGEALPNLPLWLSDDLNVPLELDASYEDTCRALRIP